MKFAIQIAAAFVSGAALVGVLFEPYKAPAPRDMTNVWVNAHPNRLTEAQKINARQPGYFARLERDAQIDRKNFNDNWRRDVISPLNQLGVQLRNWGR